MSITALETTPNASSIRQTQGRARLGAFTCSFDLYTSLLILGVARQQRQNLNEVENLYFHHSHLRSIRQQGGAAAQRPQYPTVTYPPSTSVPVLTEAHASQSPTPPGVPDQTAPSPSTNDASPSGSVSPPSQSSSEPAHNADGRPPHPAAQIPALASTSTTRPSSALDLSDPNILARLTQLHAQVQLPSLSQTQPRHPSTTIPVTSSTAAQPAPAPAPGFAPHPTSLAQPSFVLTPGTVPLYPAAPSQSPIPNSLPTSTSTSTSAPGPSSAPTPVPTTPISISTPTPITPGALTYDSFWSSHAASTGATRALYRTNTGFTASATPGGNVAMLTPGGHAAVMTAEGVYVGGGTK